MTAVGNAEIILSAPLRRRYADTLKR